MARIGGCLKVLQTLLTTFRCRQAVILSPKGKILWPTHTAKSFAAFRSAPRDRIFSAENGKNANFSSRDRKLLITIT